MSNISDIINAFSPVTQLQQRKEKANQATAADLRILKLIAHIKKYEHFLDVTYFYNNWEIKCSPLCLSLSFSDLKVSQEYCPRATDLLIKHLKLEQNLKKIKPTFSVMKRMEEISEAVLESVSMYFLRLTWDAIALENSPVWYGLVDEVKFLHRQVKDLKEAHIGVRVVAARIKEIEINNPVGLNKFLNTSYRAPKKMRSLDLTFGKMRLLSGGELNSIASKLPANAGALVSDKQISSLDFMQFSGEFLDRVVGGDETDEEITRRLKLLRVDQIEIFLKKSSGRHFSKFYDSFYKTLPLSRLSKAQVEALFDDYYGQETEQATHHLHLVSAQEISKGFHLLSGTLARRLSDAQMTFLDYSSMNEDQINTLFNKYHYKNNEEYKKRVQLIPVRLVNDVIKINPTLTEAFSIDQFIVLNTALLDQYTVRNLFPAFTTDSLHPGFTFTEKDDESNGKWYKFKLETKDGTTIYNYTKKELEDKLSSNEVFCFEMAQKFSGSQLRNMVQFMHPELQEKLKFLFIPNRVVWLRVNM